MKLIGKEKEKLLFQLGRREKDLLLQLASLYPRIPPTYGRLSRKAKVDPANQHLLEESMAAHRKEQHAQLEALIKDKERWHESSHGWRLSLSPEEVERLLAVLNDIRVGSWILLGSPENPIQVLNEHNAPHVWAMEIAGSFQMALLHTLESAGPE